MENPLINIKEIGRKYVIGTEVIHALKSVSLEIRKGEFVALMGPSGSGKSTLMNILGCLDTPSKGDYILNGINVSQMTDDALAEVRNKEIGFVFQTFNLLPRISRIIRGNSLPFEMMTLSDFGRIMAIPPILISKIDFFIKALLFSKLT